MYGASTRPVLVPEAPWCGVVEGRGDLPYAKFAATITNFDHPEYGDRNRQRVGYLLAQVAACEAALEGE